MKINFGFNLVFEKVCPVHITKEVDFFNLKNNRFVYSLWKTLVLQKTEHPHNKTEFFI
jgi:hypothetical protein